MPDRVILHSDLNHFYAAVECLYRPEIRNKPMAVCGDPVNRHGIVLAKNPIAKSFGIITGETIWQARQKCPGMVVIEPDYYKYMLFSRRARDIYNRYTDLVESFGLDECWLDISDCPKNEGPAVADEIRWKIRNELGITASIGVSYNKIFAKLGSDMKKPDATTVITRENYQSLVRPLPASDLLYIGPSTAHKLKRIGVHTIGQVVDMGPDLLHQIFGVVGYMLYTFASGMDCSPVASGGREVPIKSVGNSITGAHDLHTPDDIKAVAIMLTESVASRLRDAGFAARTVQVSLRDYHLYNFERQMPLPRPTQLASEISRYAIRLILDNFVPGQWIRSLGVRACNLVSTSDLRQQSFLPDDLKARRLLELEKTIDQLRSRFGGLSVRRGISLVDRPLTEHDIKGENIIHPTSYLP
jgi:DNA polymerase IV